MTNGEMIKTIFPNEEMYEQTPTMTYYGMMRFDTEWWNAEYKEPTTKNDLGVERQIKEICISYPKSDLKEHDGQPYYSVKYIENGEEYEGYGTYKIEVFMEYLKNYFMPSVTPQESKKGYWVHGEYCSECGWDIPAYIIARKWQKYMDTTYCPNCGAKMEVRDKE